MVIKQHTVYVYPALIAGRPIVTVEKQHGRVSGQGRILGGRTLLLGFATAVVPAFRLAVHCAAGNERIVARSLLDLSATGGVLMRASARVNKGGGASKGGSKGGGCPSGGEYNKECSGHGDCEVQEPKLLPSGSGSSAAGAGGSSGAKGGGGAKGGFLELASSRVLGTRQHEARARGRLAKGGGGGAKGGAKGGASKGAVVKKCECDEGFEGQSCELDLLMKGQKSPLDPSNALQDEHLAPPCVGRMEDFALDDPCADPRRTRIPMAPADPPDPGTKDEWPAWAKDTEGEEGWRQFKGNEAWNRKKGGGGEDQAAVRRRRRR